MSLSTCEKCGGHIPLGPAASNCCEKCGEHVMGSAADKAVARCSWCRHGITEDQTVVLRHELVYHVGCLRAFRHFNKGNTMNEADKATAPSSAATDFGPTPSLTGKSQAERDAIIAAERANLQGSALPLPAGLAAPIQAADPVNHPKHYTSHPSGVECITVTEHMGFNLGNAVKYIWRADLKADAIEDLKKARWYIDREIAKRERTKL